MPRHGVKTDEKSNEITAVPQLLEKLELNGCIVTIDAMGCQREIAQRITENGADYALAVKENQGQWPELKAAVRVVGHRATAAGDASQPRYCISSLAGSAEQLLAAIRGHPSIENSLHWTLGRVVKLSCQASKRPISVVPAKAGTQNRLLSQNGPVVKTPGFLLPQE